MTRTAEANHNTTLTPLYRAKGMALEISSVVFGIVPHIAPNNVLWRYLNMNVGHEDLSLQTLSDLRPSSDDPEQHNSWFPLHLTDGVDATEIHKDAQKYGGRFAVAVDFGGVALATEIAPYKGGIIVGTEQPEMRASLGYYLPDWRHFLSLPFKQQ